MSLGRRPASERRSSGTGTGPTLQQVHPSSPRPVDHEALTIPRGLERFRLATAQRIGRYEVVRELARGGMGVVFVARDPELGREVALKVLKPFAAEDAADEIERFKREARAMARMHHPNVVAVHDAGCDGDIPYLVMDLVEGPSLKDLIKQRGLLDPRQAAALGAKVARALQHAHEQGVLHRDVKPANVLVKDGEPLLVDFGLARGQALGSTAHLTRTGEVLGTPLYMAPEQARGELDQIDTRTDVYALGATLYHALTGRTPFQGPDPTSVFASIATELPPSIQQQLPGFDPALESIVLRCLQKERADRPQTARALADELEAWLGSGAAPAGRPAVASTAPASEARTPWALMAALGIIALGSAAAVVVVLGGRGDPVVLPTPAPVAPPSPPPPDRQPPPPLPTPPPGPTFVELLQRGKDAVAIEDWSAARTALEKATSLSPHDVEALALLGRVLVESQRNAEALRVLDRALEIDPSCALALAKRGLAKAFLGRQEEGLADMEAALAIEPSDAVTQFNRAVILHNLKRPPGEVVSALDQALRHSPPDWLAANIQLQKAFVLIDSEDLAGARVAAADAKRLADPDSNTRSRAEQLLQQLGQ